jgi:hypothetical protein
MPSDSQHYQRCRLSTVQQADDTWDLQILYRKNRPVFSQTGGYRTSQAALKAGREIIRNFHDTGRWERP